MVRKEEPAIPASRETAPAEPRELLREALEKLAEKWAEHKPYRDDEYWDGVRACAAELKKVLAALAPAPGPTVRNSSKDSK